MTPFRVTWQSVKFDSTHTRSACRGAWDAAWLYRLSRAYTGCPVRGPSKARRRKEGKPRKQLHLLHSSEHPNAVALSMRTFYLSSIKVRRSLEANGARFSASYGGKKSRSERSPRVWEAEGCKSEKSIFAPSEKTSRFRGGSRFDVTHSIIQAASILNSWSPSSRDYAAWICQECKFATCSCCCSVLWIRCISFWIFPRRIIFSRAAHIEIFFIIIPPL